MTAKLYDVAVNRGVDLIELGRRADLMIDSQGTASYLARLVKNTSLISPMYSEVVVVPLGFSYYEQWSDTAGRIQQPTVKDGVFALGVSRINGVETKAWIVWEEARAVWIVCMEQFDKHGHLQIEANDDRRYPTFAKAWESFCSIVTGSSEHCMLLSRILIVSEASPEIARPSPPKIEVPKPKAFGGWS